MVERKGPRKEEWERFITLPSHNARAQYIIDRYLKKVRLPKYKNMGTREEDMEDFNEIIELGYFTLGDLAKYYTLVKGKVPPSLDQELEIILYKKQQKKEPLMENPKKSIVEKPKKVTKKKTTTNKKAKSSNFAEVDDKEVTFKTKSILDIIKAQMKKERSNNLLKEPVIEEKDTRPIFKKQKDAENYNNEYYKKVENDRKKRYQQGKVELGKLTKDFEKLSTDGNVELEIKNLEKRIGKLPMGSFKSIPLGKRLRDISQEELSKRRKTIFMEDIPSKSKKKTKIISPASSSSSSSSSMSLNEKSPSSSTSEKSQDNWYDYF